MRIFYKMKKMLLIGAALLCTGTTYSQDAAEYGVVWSQDFEDEATFSDGFKSGNTDRYSIKQITGYKVDSKAVSFYALSNNNGTTNTFTPTTELANALQTYKDEYQFDFYYYQVAGNNQASSGIEIAFENNYLVSLLTAATNGPAIVSINGTATESSIPNKTWCHVIINTNNNGTTLTIESIDGTTAYLSSTIVAEVACALTKISNPTKRYNGEFCFDDMTLSAPGATEGITAPTIEITAANYESRTVSIKAGVGSAGTVASATYYTTDDSAPNQENGKLYSEPFEISETTIVKAISYLANGTASEVTTLKIEAGTTISLNKDIVKVTALTEENNAPIVNEVYTNEGVIGTPEVTITYTFNDETVELPFTPTTTGTLVATASAEGYETTTEELELYPVYQLKNHVDFTTTTIDNLSEFEGGRWSLKDTNTRWANWDKAQGDIYNTASLSDDFNGLMAGDFLQRKTTGTLLLVGYGLGRNNSGTTSFGIANAIEGDIALYEVNGTYKLAQPANYTETWVTYADDAEMTHTITGTVVLAKVSVYTPVRELVINDQEIECDDFAPEYSYYTSAVYNRELKSDGHKYGLICLPFAPDAESLANFQFYALVNADNEGVTFEEVEAPEANTPYLYSVKDGATCTNQITGGAVSFEDVENAKDAAKSVQTDAGWTLVGSLKNQTITCTESDNNYFFNPQQNTLHKVTKTLTVYPYTAYFKAPLSDAGNGTVAQTMRVRISGPTGIKEISRDQVEGLDGKNGMFDLQGRSISQPVKGQVYIENGEKKVKN